MERTHTSHDNTELAASVDENRETSDMGEPIQSALNECMYYCRCVGCRTADYDAYELSLRNRATLRAWLSDTEAKVAVTKRILEDNACIIDQFKSKYEGEPLESRDLFINGAVAVEIPGTQPSIENEDGKVKNE